MAAPSSETRLINTREGLTLLAAELEGADVLALDTEFIRERSYAPRLELVQVASRTGVIAAIDYGTLGRLENDPFVELLRDPTILKVFHAAEQDLEILQMLLGEPLTPMFDTQLAAGLAGFSAKPGYGALVEGILKIRLPKGESMTDWSIRPLTQAQLDYALDDVRHLLPVFDRLRAMLHENGRMEWAEQECGRLQHAVAAQFAARANPETLYMRVRGRGGLDSQGLHVLRALALWREEEARRRDRPRGSILKDEILVEFARRAPRKVQQLRNLRGIQPRDLDRYAETLIQVIADALSSPRSEYPVAEPPSGPPDEATLALADLLQAVTHTIAAESGIAATLLATNSDLQRLAEAYRRGEHMTVNFLEGWRAELLGDRLLEVLEGRSALGWDPKGQRLSLVPLRD